MDIAEAAAWGTCIGTINEQSEGFAGHCMDGADAAACVQASCRKRAVRWAMDIARRSLGNMDIAEAAGAHSE